MSLQEFCDKTERRYPVKIQIGQKPMEVPWSGRLMYDTYLTLLFCGTPYKLQSPAFIRRESAAYWLKEFIQDLPLWAKKCQTLGATRGTSEVL